MLCPHCKTELPFETGMLPPAFKPPGNPETMYVAAGCEHCFYTGYKGRKAVYEVIPVDATLQEAIRNNTQDISTILTDKKIKTLSAQAWELFFQGSTSIAEVYPILMNESY
jgi:general secretion pathway protein E/type IV pilus assembly protein PilB